MLGAGGNHSGARSCSNGPGGTTLGLAIGALGMFDRDDAAGCGVGKPVNPSNGNMFIRQSDFALPATDEEPIALNRTYNSMVQVGGLFGLGWTSEFDERLARNCSTPLSCSADFLLFTTPDGRMYHFKFEQNLGNQTDLYLPITPGIQSKVYRYTVSPGAAEIVFQDGRVHRFDNHGRFLWRRDRNGNQTTHSYDGNGRLIGVTDAFGRTLTFTPLTTRSGTRPPHSRLATDSPGASEMTPAG